MIINKAAIFAVTFILSTVACAGGMQNEPDACWGNVGSCQEPSLPESAPWLRVFALSAGPGWTNNGSTQTVFSNTGIQKTYYAVDERTTLFNGELFFGAQHAIHSIFLGQVGVALAVASNAHLSGYVWDNAAPDASPYAYHYDVNHAHLALKGKLLADVVPFAQPYVSASVGVGANRSHDFSMTPKIYQQGQVSPFQNHTVTAFAYTLGLGAQTAISHDWQIGLGYELASWGESQLALARGQTTTSALKLSNIYTNTLQFTLSYTG